MKLLVFPFLFLVATGGTLLRAGGHPTTCPAPEDIQSEYVRREYQEKKHAGFYYELAFKDATQPRGCKCITSNKTIMSADKLLDDFSVECAGRIYHSDLSFDLAVDPNRRGYMIGKWNNFSLVRGVSFPNTIVDVGVNEDSGNYDWVIEFQCKEQNVFGYKWIEYYGLNLYSRTYRNQASVVAEMVASARIRGLAEFLDSGLELYIVDHRDCLVDHR